MKIPALSLEAEEVLVYLLKNHSENSYCFVNEAESDGAVEELINKRLISTRKSWVNNEGLVIFNKKDVDDKIFRTYRKHMAVCPDYHSVSLLKWMAAYKGYEVKRENMKGQIPLYTLYKGEEEILAGWGFEVAAWLAINEFDYNAEVDFAS